MGRSVRRRNPFSFLFATTKRDQYLERYVLREYRRGAAVRATLGTRSLAV